MTKERKLTLVVSRRYLANQQIYMETVSPFG